MFGYCHKLARVVLPFLDATVVITSMLVVIDEGDNTIVGKNAKGKTVWIHLETKHENCQHEICY